MEAPVQELLRPALLAEAGGRYGIAADSLETLGDFENFVYACQIDGRPAVLRLTHSSHRSARELEGELDWLAHLAARGLGVAAGLPSLAGKLVEPLTAIDGSTFCAVAFEHAPGIRAGQARWGPALYRAWGAALGAMHAATLDYPLGAADAPGRLRHRWDESHYIRDAADILPPEEAWALEKLAELRAQLGALSTERAGFGLIHEDLHASNFFVIESDPPRIVAFDFDDCSYHWLIDDLAMAFYYALWSPAAREDPPAFAREFLSSLWEGYRAHYPLDAAWIAEIPKFLALRDVLLYVVFHAKWDPTELVEGRPRMMDVLRQRIQSGAPVVDLDFAALAVDLGAEFSNSERLHSQD
jgi:Ser/Thr protein kinase RdoA (MazF antagonist)